MKPFPLLLLFFLGLLYLTSCNKNEPLETTIVEQQKPKENAEEKEQKSEPEIYFTLNVPPSHDSALNRRYYIILHDADGVLLDFKPYHNGSQLQFRAQEGQTITDKISVTQFRSFASGTDNVYFVNSYQDVVKGSIWKLNGESETTSYPGEFDITVTGIPDWKLFSLNNKDGFGGTNSSSGVYSGRPDADTSQLFIKDQRWFPDNDYILSILDKNAELRYIDIENVQPEDSLVFDASDLKRYDNYLNIAIPEATSFAHSVSGFEPSESLDGKGWQLSHSYDLGLNIPIDELTLGYLDRFTKFKTVLSLEGEDYFYRLKVFGDKPTALTIPNKANFTLIDGSIQGIHFDTDVPYARQESVWSYAPDFFSPNTTLGWTVNAPNPTETKIGKLPDKILKRFPGLKPDELSHQNTILFLRADTMDEFLNKRFGNGRIESGYVEETMLFGKRR